MLAFCTHPLLSSVPHPHLCKKTGALTKKRFWFSHLFNVRATELSSLTISLLFNCSHLTQLQINQVNYEIEGKRSTFGVLQITEEIETGVLKELDVSSLQLQIPKQLHLPCCWSREDGCTDD